MAVLAPTARGATLPKRALLNPGLPFLRASGTKPPKSKWEFTKAGEDWFCFAGLWRPLPDSGGDATLLMTDPAPDGADPQSTDGCTQPLRLAGLARLDPPGRRASLRVAGGGVWPLKKSDTLI